MLGLNAFRTLAVWVPALLLLALGVAGCVPQTVEGRAQWIALNDAQYQAVFQDTVFSEDKRTVVGQQVHFKAWSNLVLYQREDAGAYVGLFTSPSLPVFGVDVNPIARMGPSEVTRYLVELLPSLLEPLGLAGSPQITLRDKATLSTSWGVLEGVVMEARAGEAAALVTVYTGKVGADHVVAGLALPATAGAAEQQKVLEAFGANTTYPAAQPGPVVQAQTVAQQDPRRFPKVPGDQAKGATLSFYPFNPTKEVMDDLHVIVSGPCANITDTSSDSFKQSKKESISHNGKTACKVSFDQGKVAGGQSASVEIKTVDVKPVPQILGFYWTQGGKQAGSFKDNTRDSDRDGLPDWYEEEVTGTKPKNPDSDGDKTPDGKEDNDGDGLTNEQEYANGTDPRSGDTDGDGTPDDKDTAPRDPNKK